MKINTDLIPLATINSDGLFNHNDKKKLNNLTTYSTTEVDTGKIWKDGKPIYRKVIHSGACSLSTTPTKFSTNITNVSTIVDINFIYKYSTNIQYKIWNLKELAYDTTSNEVSVATTLSSSFTDSDITIEYTKTS